MHTTSPTTSPTTSANKPKINRLSRLWFRDHLEVLASIKTDHRERTTKETPTNGDTD